MIEHEFIIGELPNPGMEIIFRIETDIDSGSSFYTDTNGRGELKRTLNHRETWKLNQTEQIAGNYYPINSQIRIQNEETGAAFSMFPGDFYYLINE